MSKASETIPNPRFANFKMEKRTMVTVPLEEIQMIRDRLNAWRHKHHESKILFTQVHALYERLAKQVRPQQTAASTA